MSDRPNIVFMLPDQLRADFLSCYGARFIHTPGIDSIADQGVQYECAYSASPVCVPARVSLLTGMNAIKNGVLDNGHFLAPNYRDSGLRTWPDILSAAGYHTEAIGKMHFHPWESRMGFQHRVIAEDKIWVSIEDDYSRLLADHGYRKTVGYEKAEYHANHGAFVSDVPWELQVDRFVGQQACRFLREYEDERPFALMVGFPGPHNPYDPAPEFAKRFDPEDMPGPVPEAEPLGVGTSGMRSRGSKSWYAIENAEFNEGHMRTMRAYYAALVQQIDREVGGIMETLRDRGLLDNTVVILSSDHGDYLGDHGLTGKNSFFESATRVPLVMHVPGASGRREYDGLVQLTDISPTMLGYGGCEAPAYMDARVLPEAGLEDGAPRDYVIGMLGTGVMAYDGRWRLCKYADGQTMLFDLSEDADEQHNLYGAPRYAREFQRLDEVLTREIIRSVKSGTYEKRCMHGSLSNSSDYGALGWKRPYPGAIEK